MGPEQTVSRFVIFLTFALTLVTITTFFTVQGCNEAVCASIVSKCMLTQSCKCELRNCTCCKECFSCLDYLYAECCSCVEMCPKPNNTASELSRKSHVEDLTEPTPDLFAALTDDRDILQRWLTFTFPVDLDIALFKPKLDKEIKYKTINSEQEVIPLKDLITVNCTVAYMSQCMSWNKCKASCISMGSSSYRYLHEVKASVLSNLFFIDGFMMAVASVLVIHASIMESMKVAALSVLVMKIQTVQLKKKNLSAKTMKLILKKRKRKPRWKTNLLKKTKNLAMPPRLIDCNLKNLSRKSL